MPKSARKVDLMLDSGAFSAFKKGETINLKAYAKYVKKFDPLLFSYVTMDVLPGYTGAAKSDADRLRKAEDTRDDATIETAASKSYENHARLKDMDLHPIPVFHQGEDFKWLQRMLDEKEPYIGISAIKSGWNDPGLHKNWFDKIWAMLPPGQKVHGFGITGSTFLLSYPWYSVDSTTWSKGAGFGKIYVPRMDRANKDFDWRAPCWQCSVSGVGRVEADLLNPGAMIEEHGSEKWRGSKRGHIEAQGVTHTGIIERFLNEYCDLTLDQVRDSSHLRRKAILIYYLTLAKVINVRIMFATSIGNRAWATLMNEVGATDRLLSYYELRAVKDEITEEFILKGTRSVRGERNNEEE